MLNLIKSNRMENLAEVLCAVISQVPEDPMTPEFIGIQSRGMKQWLTRLISVRFGVCSNIQFQFPRQLLEYVQDLVEARDSKSVRKEFLLDRDMMTWAVMDCLMDMDRGSNDAEDESQSEGPGLYIKNDHTGMKTLALARRIATVFDDYQIYRPDLLADWRKTSDIRQAANQDVWQAKMWKDLVKKGMPLPERMDSCLSRLAEPESSIYQLPERISLFGVSTMPPRFLEAFEIMARQMEIYLFLLTPSAHFFFDLKSKRQQERIALQEPLNESFDLDVGNPLLSALGRSGREFHGILENFDYHEPMEDLFADPLDDSQTDSSMLKVIQSDILNLIAREPGLEESPVSVGFDDRSISIHACHSPMREAQVLKDLILDAFDRVPDLYPHDVIVMMPDIEAYAPFLEAVFSQEPGLPYTISDRRKRSESVTLEGFLNILQLKESRLEKSKVLDLLSSPVIAGKFGLSMADQETLSISLDAAGVLWGKDKAHRVEILGKGYTQNTWTFGLERLMTGYALPAGQDDTAGSVLPCDGFEGLEADLLGRCAHFIHTLFGVLDRLDHAGTLDTWIDRFKNILQTMLASDQRNEGDIGFLLAALDEMAEEGHRAGFKKKISFQAARDALTAKLDRNVSQGSFLAGSITFCNLMPMRSIPFKLVCLMGMDEKSFPRNQAAPGFDLIRQHPRLGDKLEREEDCYLFLESLLSAREQLIITYTGMSISDNSPIPCAVPVAELADVVEKSFDFSTGFVWQYVHPPHPFNPAYFVPPENNQLPNHLYSFSQSQCRIAQDRQTKAQVLKSQGKDFSSFCFTTGDEIENANNMLPVQAGEEELSIELSELIRFFRHPVQDYVTRTMGLVFPEMGEEINDREPFQVRGLSQYQLGSQVIKNDEDQDLYSLVKAAGQLPFGHKGEVEWRRIEGLGEPVKKLAQDIFPDESFKRLDIDIKTGAYLLTGQVKDVHSSGRAVCDFGQVTPGRLLTQWIHHLAYCAVAELPGPTQLIGRDPDKRKPVVVFEFDPVKEQAGSLIEKLARYFQLGSTRVLPFFCTPCFYMVKDLSKREYELDDASLEKCLSKAGALWSGNNFVAGEIQNRYTSLVFKDINPFANPDALRQSGVLDIGLSIFKPMLENMNK